MRSKHTNHHRHHGSKLEPARLALEFVLDPKLAELVVGRDGRKWACRADGLGKSSFEKVQFTNGVHRSGVQLTNGVQR